MSAGRHVVRPLSALLGTMIDTVGLMACAMALSACGGPGDEVASEAAYAAEGRVVGDWQTEASLLVLSRSGGQPQLRAASDPSLIVWRRDDPLPAVEISRPMGPRTVVFRSSGGQTFLWDLSHERATALGDVEPDAAWQASEGAVAFWSADRVRVAEEAGVRQYEAPSPVIWAMPGPEDVVVVLVEGQDGRALVALDKSSERVAELPLDVAAPGIATAWGRQAIFRSADGDELVVIGVPELREERRYSFRRPVTAFAVSGSSHEIYVAQENGRVEAVQRVSGDRRELAELDGEILELRPGMYGQQLLAYGSEGVFRVSLAGGRPVRLPVDWRPDLPLGLPSGQILAARGDSLYMVRVGLDSRADARLEALDGPAEVWWLPLRWNPESIRVAAARGQVAEESRPAREPTAEPSSSAEGGSSDTAVALASDREAAPARESTEAAGTPADSIGVAFAEPAAGYYAVAMASRTADGVISLVGALARSGYPTAVQRRRDDAGQMWYRALVGPYTSREGAEAAARQLRRERSFDAWVMELTAGGEGEF